MFSKSDIKRDEFQPKRMRRDATSASAFFAYPHAPLEEKPFILDNY